MAQAEAPSSDKQQEIVHIVDSTGRKCQMCNKVLSDNTARWQPGRMVRQFPSGAMAVTNRAMSYEGCSGASPEQVQELWPEPNERGKIECADCHAEFTNPIAFLRHQCFPDLRGQFALDA